MDKVTDEYRSLMHSFVTGRMTAADFQKEYLDKFKNERNRLADHVYEILQLAFGYVDSFTSDSELLTLRPAFYVDEKRLKTEIAALITRLAHA